MSTMQSPPPDAPQGPVATERRCARCGSALAPDQEWCLVCGAAAGTEIAEPRGWRVPIVVGGGLIALAIAAIVLVIFVLATNPSQKVATPTPTPTVTAAPTASPSASATPGATATASPGASATPSAGATVTPTPSAGDGSTDTGTTSFPAWPGGSGWTIIIASETSQSSAEAVAQKAQDNGETVGILQSDDYSSLNAGYWVVFTQKYDTQGAAQDALAGVQADHKTAYVREVSP